MNKRTRKKKLNELLKKKFLVVGSGLYEYKGFFVVVDTNSYRIVKDGITLKEWTYFEEEGLIIPIKNELYKRGVKLE